MASSDSSPPLAKRARLSFTETIDVLVGPDKTKFVIHPDKICKASPFFEAACARWKKSGEPVVLSDDSPEVFQAYLDYIYSATLPPMLGPDDARDYDLLGGIYILADKLGDLRTANAAIDEIIRIGKVQSMIPNVTISCEWWEATPENSPLRLLLVDYYVHETPKSFFDNSMTLLPREMVDSIAKTMRRRYWEGAPIRTRVVDKPRCHYHQHNDAFPACQ